MSLRVLVTDIQSALGRTLVHDLEREHCHLLSAIVDWEDAASVQDYFVQHKPDVVINTIGWGEVAALNSSLMPRVAGNLAHTCASLHIPLVHFSSYKVFGLDHKSSHSEKDVPAPVNIEGEAFLAAERAIEQRTARFIVLRLGWIIGSLGDNHLTRLLAAIQAQQPITLNACLRGAPTLLSDVVRVCVALVKQIGCGAENWGVMHYCSGDALNEAEFAEQLVLLLAQQQLLKHDANFTVVDSVSTDEPMSAVLGCRLIRDAFGVQAHPWRQSLLPLVKQWFHASNL